MDLIHRGADAGPDDDGTFVIITLTPLFMQAVRQHSKGDPCAQLFASYVVRWPDVSVFELILSKEKDFRLFCSVSYVQF